MAKKPTQRTIERAKARSAGYHNDSAAFTRAVIERRVTSYEVLKAEWKAGAEARKNGIPCYCPDCKR